MPSLQARRASYRRRCVSIETFHQIYDDLRRGVGFSHHHAWYAARVLVRAIEQLPQSRQVIREKQE